MRQVFPMPTNIKPEREAAFWALVDKSQDCWIWTGNANHKGYGRFNIGGTEYKPHRLSYFWHNGTDPIGYYVCHSCDNPRCVNPAHLWLGRPFQNTADCRSKGRNTPAYKGRADRHDLLAECLADALDGAPGWRERAEALVILGRGPRSGPEYLRTLIVREAA